MRTRSYFAAGPSTRLLPFVALTLCLGAAISGACGDGAGAAGGGASPSTSSSVTSSEASSSTVAPLPDTFDLQGIVTDGMAPVAGAIVMQGGGSPAFTTGADGTFTITMTKGVGTPTVVAAKVGFRAAGEEITELPTVPVNLVLFEVKPPDNIGYVYGDPGTGVATHDNSTAYCGHCHTTYVADFQTSAHAMATRDPIVQDLYAGVASGIATPSACALAGGVERSGTTPGQPGTASSRCYVGVGVLPSLNTCGAVKSCDDPTLPAGQKPTKFGNCADCHAAGLDGPAGGRDLLESTGISFQNGNHCDACHHVRDIDPTSSKPGVAGALVMQRPHETMTPTPGSKIRQAMFGPYPDVPSFFMGGSYQPKFSTSEFCSGCHEYRQAALLSGATLDPAKWPDRLPTLSTYSEWKDSSYDTPGTQCQFCHMPPKQGLFNTVDVTTPTDASISFGFGRDSMELRSHIFRSPLEGTPRLIDGALTGGVMAVQAGATLDVTTSIKNVGAGHAMPTGEPMRALVLSVRVDGCGQRFAALAGMTIPDFGGSLASGIVGGGVTVAGTSVDWPAGASTVQVGDVVRIVRPSGTFDDYPGVGYFANPALTAQDKGIEIDDPVGEATIVGKVGSTLTLEAAINAQSGDLVYVGTATDTEFSDGEASRSLAGSPGQAFARVMLDPGGVRFAPHFRANDIASDNRLPPQIDVPTENTFAIPSGCTSAVATAALLYRPLPVDLARERAWDGRDYVVLTTTQSLVLQ